MNAFTWLYILAMLWLLVFLLLRNNRKLMEKGIYIGPFYAIFKTTKLNDIIVDMSKRWPLLWRVLLDIGIAMGLGQLIFSIYWLGQNLIAFFIHPARASPVYPIIPGITIDLRYFAKYIIPILIIVAFTHEIAHGVASIIGKVPIKSVGVMIVFCLIGAFVEPDEDILRRSRVKTKLRIFAAGSLVNLFTALIFLLLLSSFFQSTPSGVLIVSTVPGYPAHNVIPNYSVIVGLNNTRIFCVTDLVNFMRKARPGEIVNVTYIDPKGCLKSSLLRLKADIHNKNRALLGINIVNFVKPRLKMNIKYSFEVWNFLLTGHVISLSVAVFNMLPIYPFDGARFLFTILDNVISKKDLLKYLKASIMSISIALLVLNIVFTFR